ncbi:GTP-binding protein ypt5 [Tritrichomonas foetus]|uniref:GTP-binding protein ypt5 n=1 Tax=Tritrichomonas foetus TaxID=1144522 RepID=A0A1J4KRN1_9EUKA|nr:GTP-binding protein ypt5 [Tritrichomonas foetus]|eukprot:OHT13927.1 GTP-binding protein ypt5 [Tritrichomonas foetus]
MKKTADYKVILVGDTSVGKTSIIMRFQHDVFNPNHLETVGASFITKQVDVLGSPANLNIWDTAGQEKYRSLVPMYTRNASTAVIVFDLTNPQSLTILQSWHQQVKEEAPENCKIVFVGNKLDLQATVDRDSIGKYAADQGVDVFYVSALSGQGINELFEYITKSLPSTRYSPTTETISLGNGQKKSCC